MSLLEFVIKEYLTIVGSLEESETVENGRIIIERERFKSLLEKYRYMNFREKTKIYKDLNFIIHDKNNYTIPCKDHKINKTVRKVAINYSTYETVKHLMETDIK